MDELEKCSRLLRTSLLPQKLWPFSYPYGKTHTFNSDTVQLLQGEGFACAFATVKGDNEVGSDGYSIRRLDPKDIAW